VDDGSTGFLVETVDEAVAAVERVGFLDRHGIREQAVARFDKSRMIDAYLDAYRALLAGRAANGS
jgi:glycosyltransferase involved in cell wall biosynthesis